MSRTAPAIFLAAILFLASLTPGQAKYASLVMDAESGRVLYETNADTRNFPASLTKMMTLYMVFDALERRKLSMDEYLPASAKATRQPASKVGLRLGETISVKNAIQALATKSANDVAVVVAEALGGTERRFAVKMTAMARKIGMKRTTFRNASGLPHRGQLSTARDMAQLGRRLMRDFPQYYKYFSRRTFSYGGVTHKTHNKLLKTYRGVDGIKTGYIRASGFNLVASARRNGHRLIGVVFGGRTSRSRNYVMTRLLNDGFKKLEYPAYAKASPKPKPRYRKRTPVRKIKKAAPRTQIVTRSPKGPVIWGIQVGAYKRYGQAYKRATNVFSKYPRYLKSGTVEVSELSKRNRRSLYRARIAGISKRQAYRACKVLERRRIDCMEFSRKTSQVAWAR
ncbi:MAG: D-alanyl-D-alanine carboxypeptidase [Rhodospirillales bacterium]|nr:D-alanyl-D-alanine carboxypeptidase [Rhodospirillales bacterium]